MENLDEIWNVVDQLRPRSQSEEKKVEEHFCGRCGHVKHIGVYIELPTCSGCGAVDDFSFCYEPEWRTGADHEGDDPCRVGAPENLDHYSQTWNLGTLISKKGKNVGKLLIRQLHSNVNHKDRSLWLAYKDLDRIGEMLSLPACVLYDAKIKYRKFTENVLTRGAVRNGIKANCLFQACREHKVARTIQEIATAFEIPAKDISRTFDMYTEQNPETKVHVARPADLIPRLIGSVIGIPEEQRGRWKMKVIAECEKLEKSVKLAGRTPKAVACAVMHVLLGKYVGKAELCRICEVSGPTLTKIEAIVKSELKM